MGSIYNTGGRMFWTHPSLILGSSKIDGNAYIAEYDIPVQSLLIIQGGYIMTIDEEAKLTPLTNDLGVQIAENHVLSPGDYSNAGGMKYVNHSCDANASVRSANELIAIRNIQCGEEITFDYATVLYSPEGSSGYEMICACGSTGCREKITDQDYLSSETVHRLDGRFSPFLKEILRQRKVQQ